MAMCTSGRAFWKIGFGTTEALEALEGPEGVSCASCVWMNGVHVGTRWCMVHVVCMWCMLSVGMWGESNGF